MDRNIHLHFSSTFSQILCNIWMEIWLLTSIMFCFVLLTSFSSWLCVGRCYMCMLVHKWLETPIKAVTETEESKSVVISLHYTRESICVPSPRLAPGAHSSERPSRGGDIGWNRLRASGHRLSLLYFSLHPFSPTEQININTKKKDGPDGAPGCCSQKLEK